MTALEPLRGIILAEVGDPERMSFPLEQLAIEASNGLRAAEADLEAVRSRTWVGRIMDSATGQGQKRQAAIGSSQVTVLRAILDIIGFVREHQICTLYCQYKMSENLYALNRDFDSLVDYTKKGFAREGRLENEVKELRASMGKELLHRAEVLAALKGEIHRVKQELGRQIDRESALSRLRDAYLGGQLHPGAGELLGAAFYTALRTRHFYGEGAEVVQRERQCALNVVRQRLSPKPKLVPELVLDTVRQVSPKNLRLMKDVLAGSPGPAGHALVILLERYIAGRPLEGQGEHGTMQIADEALRVARAGHDQDGRFWREILSPAEWVEEISGELDGLEGGKKA